MRTRPSISVVVTAFNSAEHIRETLVAILGQTHPADEVIVVDDGSTDDTPAELDRFGDRIRVIRRPNGGHAAALNTGFAEARGDYVAKCDADDVWELFKLERQFRALRDHPEIDIAFGAARFFGLEEGAWGVDPGEGVLDPAEFACKLYEWNLVCATTTLVRRSLYEQLGPFVEGLDSEDYEYWLRALRAEAVFFYDRCPLLACRRHSGQVTHQRLRVQRAVYRTHCLHAELVDGQIARRVQARDLARIGRMLVDEGQAAEARSAFAESLRRRPLPRTAAWTLLLTLPRWCRPTLAGPALS